MLKQYPKVNGGIVVLDPFTGDVLALVGGFNFKTSEFNRVTQAKRQPGSAFKPIVYAAALEKGFAPNSIILDAPFVESQGVGLKNWKPENYGKKFYGPSTFRKGIEYSRNLMTVRIAKILGLEEILNLSKKLEYMMIFQNYCQFHSVLQRLHYEFNICLRSICKWRK